MSVIFVHLSYSILKFSLMFFYDNGMVMVYGNDDNGFAKHHLNLEGEVYRYKYPSSSSLT